MTLWDRRRQLRCTSGRDCAGAGATAVRDHTTRTMLGRGSTSGSTDFRYIGAAMPLDSRSDPSSPGDMPKPLGERLRELYGEDLDPGVSLGDGASAAGSASPGVGGEPPTGSGPKSKLFERLRAEGPRGTRYKFLGELARGGMGAILEVWDAELRRKLAMKVILGREDKAPPRAPQAKPGDSTPDVDPRTLGRFLEEAQITGQLDHPGIVPVHELGLDSNGRVYFTMRLVRGEDLRAVFGHVLTGLDGWNQVRALNVLLRVCEAVAFAHSKQVIHRDLKPANVMVGRFGEVVVMDWGLARVLGGEDRHDLRLQKATSSAPSLVRTERHDSSPETPDSPLMTMDGDVVGTPGFMPPEQARGELERLGPHSDVYSIGAMLYQLLTGVIPYVPPGARVSPHTILMAVLHGPPASVESLAPRTPPELVAICEKAMAREIGARYPTTGALASDLRAYLEGRVVRAYETGTWAETRKWVQRNKALAGSVAAAVLSVVAGLVGLAIKTHEANASALLAKRNAEEASSQAARAEKLADALLQSAEAGRERDNVLRLAAMQELERHIAAADELWPTSPRAIPDCEAWLASAQSLIDGLWPNPSANDGGHVARWHTLRARAGPRSPRARRAPHPRAVELDSARAASGGSDEAANEYLRRLEVQTELGAPVQFAIATDEWWHARVEELIEALCEFAHPATGLVAGTALNSRTGPSVARRLELARKISASSTDPIVTSRWRDALDAVRENPLYIGLSLEQVPDLVPLGPDPKSGLYEFWHRLSGDEPIVRADGTRGLDHASGLVLVLVPSGRTWIGAQKDDRAGHNFDPHAETSFESPAHEISVEAFYISKYELTQAQWLRWQAQNPSHFEAGRPFNDVLLTDMHPVEQVSANDARETCRRMGLRLPTEHEWEHAARAGSSLAYGVDQDGGSLARYANVADESFRAQNPLVGYTYAAFDDGWVGTAPVGSLAPSPWGLCDIFGNVFEWCEPAATLPGRIPLDPRTEILRGGSWCQPPEYARVASRWRVLPAFVRYETGVRPARSLGRP
jgi:formylglycine-generating enzyme required for sulfatase activity/serine/threonine protein kinase